MPKRYNINPIKDFDLTEYEAKKPGPVGDINWGEIGGTLSSQTDLQSALDGKVNDTGDTMTGDLAFTNAGINNANQITFNTSATETISEGVLTYNTTTANLELGLAGGNVSVGLGKELVLPRRVRNNSGTTMTKGTVVYISGASGNTPIVSRSIATSDTTSAFTIGVCAENINDNGTGWILTNGLLAGFDFSSYAVGDILYLSGTNAGEFTTVKPKAPVHYVRIGEVTKATADGEAIITIQNGYELDEIHDVQINSVQTGQILQYQTDGLWKNVTLSGVITQHNDLQGIQGGTSGEYYHLTNYQRNVVLNTSGTNTGDQIVPNNKPLTTNEFFNSYNNSTGNFTSARATWDNIDKTTSSIADITDRSHTLLTDIGSRTHETIDAELNRLATTSGTNTGGNTGDITIQDTRTIDLTLSGQLLQASVIPSGITHNSLGELQGGSTISGQLNHLTNDQLLVVQNTSGINTGDQIVPSNSSAVTNNFLTAYDSTTGSFSRARPTWANIDKTLSAIGDISDVFIASPSYGQVLSYEPAFLGWENKTLATQYNLFENAQQINNSTNGYGGLSDGWSESGGANSVQGGFPFVNWGGIWDKGSATGIWYLNESSGSSNAIDDNGVNNLTAVNTPGANSDISLMSYARSFTGTQRFSGTVSVGNVVGNQTFIAYVRPSSVSVLQHIGGYNDGTRGAYLAISATGKAQLVVTGLGTTTISSDVTLEVNKWYLIVGSYDSGSNLLKLFVNGVYKQVSTSGTHVITTNSIIQIGATNSANHYSGYMNCFAHYYNMAWDKEKMLSLFALTLYQGVKISRTNTTSEITNFTLVGREQMHNYIGQTVTLSAEVYQDNASEAKVTLYGSGMGNNDSPTATTTGDWEFVSVTVNIPASLPELYIDLRSSSGAVGSIWYRNIRLNYGSLPMNSKIHHPMDWQKFPRLLMLDIPKMVDGKPYQYEEDRWYSWTTVTAPAGATGTNTEWKYKNNVCYIKGQLTQTHASATWTHTLPIYTGANEVIYTKHLRIQNNAGTVALGNWSQTTSNSTGANMYATIANGAFSTTSGAKVAQLDAVDYEID